MNKPKCYHRRRFEMHFGLQLRKYQIVTDIDVRQVPTHCLLLFATYAGDLLDSVKKVFKFLPYRLR